MHIRHAAALVTSIGVLAWSAVAFAQAPTRAPDAAMKPPFEPPQPSVPQSPVIVLQTATTTQTRAPEPLAVQPPRREVVETGERVPNMPLLVTGAVLFGGTWTASWIVSATSGHQGDKHLWVPLVGPWLDLRDRGDLPSGPGHDTELANRLLLVANGVFQAVGAFDIVGAFVFTVRRTEKVVTDVRPELRVTPVRLDGGAYGIGAVGTF